MRSLKNLIVLEGLPGGGKSTISKMAKENLNILNLSNVYDQSLRNSWMMFSSYFSQMNEIIKCNIAQRYFDKTFLFERNYLTVLGYSYLKSEEMYQNTLTWYLKHRNRDLIAPRAYIFLNISPEKSLTRRKPRPLCDPLWLDSNCLKRFQSFYHDFLVRFEPHVKVYHIDALQPVAHVWLELLEILKKEGLYKEELLNTIQKTTRTTDKSRAIRIETKSII
jgi:thymidylate kinase